MTVVTWKQLRRTVRRNLRRSLGFFLMPAAWTWDYVETRLMDLGPLHEFMWVILFAVACLEWWLLWWLHLMVFDDDGHIVAGVRGVASVLLSTDTSSPSLPPLSAPVVSIDAHSVEFTWLGLLTGIAREAVIICYLVAALGTKIGCLILEFPRFFFGLCMTGAVVSLLAEETDNSETVDAEHFAN
jgi:hypothetical protein